MNALQKFSQRWDSDVEKSRRRSIDLEKKMIPVSKPIQFAWGVSVFFFTFYLIYTGQNILLILIPIVLGTPFSTGGVSIQRFAYAPNNLGLLAFYAAFAALAFSLVIELFL